jgi:UDP-glucose 4-epimerase
MKVFVTGGNGFIGKHLVEKLHLLGHSVTVYSRASGGDILDAENVSRTMKNHDIVIHLAAFLPTTGVQANPSDFINTNLLGSLNVIKGCLENKIQKIINLSSAAVYSDGSVLVGEEQNLEPSTVYGITKLAIEQYLRIIPELDHVNIRTPLVYGPGDSSNRVLNKFMEKHAKGEPILLFKGGDKQILDYIHVSDLCDFIVHCLDRETGTFNVCTGEPINVGILANMFTDVIIEDVAPGEYSTINTNLKRTLCEVRGVSLSNEKIKKTGWVPTNKLCDFL